ncbi:MAG: MaoC/PaaZ C-terminal domain-containing protein [Acidimicrobiales bacterium]
MALATEKLGTTWSCEVEEVDADRARAYAEATNDPNPAYASGSLAPPVFGVVPTWQSMSDALTSMVPPEAFLMIVHGEQDMHFHQPLAPGQRLATAAEAFSVRVGRSGTRYTMKVLSEDTTTGTLVLEQYVTMFIRGMSDGESAGPDKPEHGFPRGARSQPLGAVTVHVDDDQTYRYKEASGDDNAIHVDPAVATAVGLPGVIVHGLCTMAMTSQAVISSVAGGDPARLRRLAVRFSRPVFPGTDVVTSLFDAGPVDGRRIYAFEAHSGGELVISNGRAEVSP